MSYLTKLKKIINIVHYSSDFISHFRSICYKQIKIPLISKFCNDNA